MAILSTDRRHPRHISITIFLLIAIGGLVALATGTVLFVTGYANFQNTRELLIDKGNLVIDSLERDIRDHVKPAEDLVWHLGGLAARGQLDVTNKRDTVTTLQAALAAAPQLTGAVLWQPDGKAVQIERKSGHPTFIRTESNIGNTGLREHLSEIESLTEPKWNLPFRKDGISFISVSGPLRFNEQFVGGAAAAISLKELSTFVQRISGKQNLYGFILYGDKHILAHRNLPKLSTARLTHENPMHRLVDLADPVLTGLAASPILNEDEQEGFDVREVTTPAGGHIVLSREIPGFGGVPLTLGVYALHDQLDTQLRRLAKSLFAGLALIVLSLAAAIILARRVARPIKSIAAAAEQIGQMNLGRIGEMPPSHITELNNQAKAFNQMLAGLRWFETYVPRRLVNRLIKSQGNEPVVSREEVLTVMFTDIVGYTAMSESLSPAETAELLNSHFEILNQCIEAEGGTLDKYIGDAVMAFWGAPEHQDDHALRACRAALAIRKAVTAHDDKLRVKIALHSGPLIVGNIGASGRMNYTVIGDTVNTCSRIEKLASELDDGSRVPILLSTETAAETGEAFTLEPAGEFKVKGREKPVQVLRLVG